MVEVALTESHEKAYALYALDVERQRLQLFVVQQIHILFAHALEVVDALYLHRLGLDPLAVLDVAALCRNFAYVYLGVEVGRDGVAVVAAVAVENVDVVYLVELVLHGVCRENARNAGIKAASQQRCDARFFKLFAVSPLPLVLKLGGVLRLVIRGIDVVGLGSKAGVHYREVLIRQGEIEHYRGLVAFYQRYQLVNVVRVHLRRFYNSLSGGGEFFFQRVALRLRAAGYHYPLKYLAVLTALVDSYRGNAAAADYQCF